ncbi:DegT/DnrJ/EryC1/StrS family aminotransferase [Candidatus Chlorohelix sp.]|uniref:DegT/DnrJ/EryC1/StrS family aminotransferase n=1 Tax=Candidatus Chlorohelix sp. TaxID=3139201 RepID=UPI00302D6195
MNAISSQINIPIARPEIGVEEQKAVLAVMQSGQLAQGSEVAHFEEEFARACGVKYAIAVSSGTTALHTALLAYGIGEGDEVITSSFSFIATANSILYTGARPVFVDIEPVTFNLDPALIEAAITPRTKAIMPVHLFGHPAPMYEIMDIAARHGLAIIEDACQAHLAEYNGRKVGSFGTGCFSFYPTKNMTSGEGGMLTTNEEQVAERARMFRAHGMRRRYYHEMLGYNYRMTDLHASIGRVQLQKLPGWNARRRENAAYLNGRLAELEAKVVTPMTRDNCTHAFHQYTVIVEESSPIKRDQLVTHLGEMGVGCGIYYPVPIHQQDVYLNLGYKTRLPVTEQAMGAVLSLPIYPSLTVEQLERIAGSVANLTR